MTEETEVQETEPVETEAVERSVETKPAKQSRAKPVIRDNDDAILELRKENEKLRKTLEDASNTKAEKLAEQRIETAKAEAKSDAEILVNARLAEIEQRTRDRIIKSELKSAAMRAGVVDFDDLFAVMARDLKKVEFSEDGDVTNAVDIISELKDKKPHFFAGVSTSSTTQAPQSRQNTTEKLATEMSRDEYKKARARLAAM